MDILKLYLIYNIIFLINYFLYLTFSNYIMSTTTTKYALISVYNKDNIELLSHFLIENGYTIISTGGTYDIIFKSLNESQMERLIQVSDFTGFPEILNGRVKTLHPKIYAGILAKPTNQHHMSSLESRNIPLIDIVVCNLYPFMTSVNHLTPMEEAQELIDIGGVTLIRSSAKNWENVLTITNPQKYQYIMENFNHFTPEFRKTNAAEAFMYTSTYDLAIFNYFVPPPSLTTSIVSTTTSTERSEERRVGKECVIQCVDLGGRRIIQAEDGIRD